MKTLQTKHPFTLIEITLCLFLLSLIGSFGAIKGWKLLREKQFQTSLHKLENELFTAKAFALSCGVDATITISKKEGKVICTRSADLPKEMGKKERENQSSLSFLTLKNETETVSFYSSGLVKSSNTLIVAPSFDLKRKHYLDVQKLRFKTQVV